jgi:hypothetical protein
MPRGRRPRPLDGGVDRAEHAPDGVPVLQGGGPQLAGRERRRPRPGRRLRPGGRRWRWLRPVTGRRGRGPAGPSGRFTPPAGRHAPIGPRGSLRPPRRSHGSARGPVLGIGLWVARRTLAGRRVRRGTGLLLTEDRRARPRPRLLLGRGAGLLLGLRPGLLLGLRPGLLLGLRPGLLLGGVGRWLGLLATVARTVAVLRGPCLIRRCRHRRARTGLSSQGLGHRARPVLPLLPAGLHGTRAPALAVSTLNRQFRVRLALRRRVGPGLRSRRPARPGSLPAPDLGARSTPGLRGGRLPVSRARPVCARTWSTLDLDLRSSVALRSWGRHPGRPAPPGPVVRHVRCRRIRRLWTIRLEASGTGGGIGRSVHASSLV